MLLRSSREVMAVRPEASHVSDRLAPLEATSSPASVILSLVCRRFPRRSFSLETQRNPTVGVNRNSFSLLKPFPFCPPAWPVDLVSLVGLLYVLSHSSDTFINFISRCLTASPGGRLWTSVLAHMGLSPGPLTKYLRDLG